MNLVLNADKYTKSGNITINCSMTSETQKVFIYIAITDQGCGICEEDQKQLFKPFKRLENGRFLNPKGIGLGLNLCKNIIEQLKGKIWLENSVLKD